LNPIIIWLRSMIDQLRQDPYLRLMALVTSVVGFSLLIAVGVLLILQRTLVHGTGEALAIEATQTASRLDRVLHERAGDSRMMAHALLDRLDDPQYLSAYLTWMVQAYPVYQWLVVLDVKGAIIATNASAGLPQDRLPPEWFSHVAESSGLVVLEAKAYKETNGHVAVGFSIPIRNDDGLVQGFVVSFVSLAGLKESYLGMSRDVHVIGSAIPIDYSVVNSDGVPLIDSTLYEDSRVNLTALPSVQVLRETNSPGFVEERSMRRGLSLITGYAPTTGYADVPNMRWAVLARVQRSHILAPISYLTKVVGFGGLTAMGLLMGLVLLMMVRLRQEMTKVRQSHAELERRVTEAREHVRTQQQQLIQSSKLASLGQLSAGVAHELNNPLNNINLLVLNALDQVDVELKGRQLQHPLHEKLEAAAEQVQRATGVINNLRTFARASGTSMHAIVLADAIDSATALLRETLRLQQVELSIHMADRKAEVWGDRLQIEQVLVNLLTNACDALNDAAVKRIMITAEADEDWELVTVTDTGHGIAPQTLPHIFDPFFTTKEVGRGTGLGLSIVYGIIQDHGGQITAQSTPGKGTQIQLRFPRKRDRLPDLEVQTGAP